MKIMREQILGVLENAQAMPEAMPPEAKLLISTTTIDTAFLVEALTLALRALDYEAASGEVTEEIMAAAWTAYCGSRGPGTAVAIRAVVDAVAPFLSAAARRKALEEAASVAYTTPEYVAGWGSDGAMIPGSPYDRGRFDAAAAIRALKKESV